MTNWPTQAQAKQFYGNPDVNGDGRPDPNWERDNLTRVSPPYPMVLAWDTDVSVKSIWAHKLIAASLTRCLTNIMKHYGSQKEVTKARMHLYGGCYNFRLMRGGTHLSMHSYGCAIDLDPENNPLGKTWGPGMMPHEVVKIFKGEGATWGGEWSRPDCQHFQFASV